MLSKFKQINQFLFSLKSSENLSKKHIGFLMISGSTEVNFENDPLSIELKRTTKETFFMPLFN